MLRAFCVVLVLLLCPTATAAQQSGTTLFSEDVRTGDRLTVTTAAGERIRGHLLGESGDTLLLRTGGRERSLRRADIVQVDRYRNRFLFGPIIGVGAGLAVGLPARTRLDNEGSGGDVALGMAVVAGAALGTLIDLFNGKTTTVYRTPQSGVAGRYDVLIDTSRGFSLTFRRTF